MWARIGSLFILSKPPRKCEPFVGSGGGEGAGGCGHALAAFKYSLNTLGNARARGGVGGGGGEGAGGCGHALAAFKYSLNTQKMQPGVGSGEAGVVWCGR